MASTLAPTAMSSTSCVSTPVLPSEDLIEAARELRAFPEDFQYVKALVAERLPASHPNTSGIALAEELPRDRKERLAGFFRAAGFEPLKSSPFKFCAPRKKTTLKPLDFALRAAIEGGQLATEPTHSSPTVDALTRGLSGLQLHSYSPSSPNPSSASSSSVIRPAKQSRGGLRQESGLNVRASAPSVARRGTSATEPRYNPVFIEAGSWSPQASPFEGRKVVLIVGTTAGSGETELEFTFVEKIGKANPLGCPYQERRVVVPFSALSYGSCLRGGRFQFSLQKSPQAPVMCFERPQRGGGPSQQQSEQLLPGFGFPPNSGGALPSSIVFQLPTTTKQSCYAFWERCLENPRFKALVESSPLAKYELLDVLGTGTSCVRKARVRTGERAGETVAVKIIPKRGYSEALIERIRMENEIHRSLQHPTIIDLYDHFEDAEHIYLVTELAAGGDLVDYLNRISSAVPEADLVSIMRQVLAAVAHLHAHQIIHRDIKADNVVLTHPDSLICKLIDFGVSKDTSHSPSCTVVGTRDYIAPEITLVAAGDADSYSFPCDLWSCGVLMHFLASRRFPFPGDLPTHLHKPFDPSPLPLTQPAKDLLSRLLTKDPSKRITAVDALDHPLFTSDSSTHPPSSNPSPSSDVTPSTSASSASSASLFQVLHPYPPAPEEPFRLVLSVGDIITLIERRENGWMLGQSGDRQGLFPEGYVTPFTADLPPPPPVPQPAQPHVEPAASDVNQGCVIC